MLTIFSATKPGVIRFYPIYGFSIISYEFYRVIYSTSIVRGMKNIPGPRLVGMDDSAGCDFLSENRYCFPLATHHIGQRPTETFPSYRDNPTIGVTIPRRSTICP